MFILQQRERIGELNRVNRRRDGNRPRYGRASLRYRFQNANNEEKEKDTEQELLDVVHEGKSARVNAEKNGVSFLLSFSFMHTRRGARGESYGDENLMLLLVLLCVNWRVPV